jgi:molybdopterin-binding protein
MEISARNQLRGKVTAVKLGTVMAQVTVQVAGHDVVSVITRDSVERLGITVGADVIAIVKATEVILAKP